MLTQIITGVVFCFVLFCFCWFFFCSFITWQIHFDCCSTWIECNPIPSTGTSNFDFLQRLAYDDINFNHIMRSHDKHSLLLLLLLLPPLLRLLFFSSSFFFASSFESFSFWLNVLASTSKSVYFFLLWDLIFLHSNWFESAYRIPANALHDLQAHSVFHLIRENSFRMLHRQIIEWNYCVFSR